MFNWITKRFKKRGAYKPRIVKFTHFKTNEVHPIDTRLGLASFYPGDVIDCPFGGGMFLGVARSYGVVITAAVTYTNNSEKFHFIHPGMLSESTLIKRHAQHLIDTGEMIQYEEVNK